MAKCCAVNCNSICDKKNGITLHRFPLKNRELLDRWIQAVKKDEWTPNKNSLLCSNHFKKEDFYLDQGERKLRENVVPTIFAHQSAVEKSTSPENRNSLEDSNNPTTADEIENSFDYGNLMQRCEELLNKNFAKYHNYTKLQEILRLKLIGSNNDYKFLKTWMDIAYEENLTMKPKHGDLSRFYETLLKNNFVKEFLDYSKDQELLQLKFIPTITVCKDLKMSLDTALDSIGSLKSDYNKLTSFSQKKHRKSLRLLLKETIDELERLNKCLDKVYEYMMLVFSEHNDLIRRYKILSEKPAVDDFLNCAKHEERLQSKFNEKTDKCECSKTCLDRANGEIESLNLQISDAQKMLNAERQRRELIEKEHSSFNHLSEELCRLLSKCEPSIPSGVMKKTHRPIDEPIQNSVNNDCGNSNTVDEPISEISISESIIDDKDIKLCTDLEPTLFKNDRESVEVKYEKFDELSTIAPEKVLKSTTPYFNIDNSSAKNCDGLEALSTERSLLKRQFSGTSIDQDDCTFIFAKKSKN